MSDDQKPKTKTIDFGEIDNAEERVKEVIHMGKNLGFKFPEWYAVLKSATLKMESVFASKGQSIAIEVVTVCGCPKCTKEREDKKRRDGLHVVN